MVPNDADSQRDRSIWLSNWCSCKPSSASRTRSGCTPCEEQRSKVRSSSVAPCPHTHTHTCAYHPIATFRPDVHLSVVFGVVVVEGGLTLAESDHAAVVGAALPVVAEKLPAHHVSTREQQVSARPSQRGVLTWGQLTPPGRVCTGRPLFACRMRSRSPWCSGRSSIVQPQ